MRKPYVDMIGMVYVLQPHFWVWRVGGPYAMGTVEVPQGGARRVGPFFGRHIAIQPVLHTILKRHPCTIIVFVILLIFVTCLFVDAIRTATFGYAAVPIGFLFGVLVVLGLGTAARLILECWHERAVRRNIQQMENMPMFGGPYTINQSTQLQTPTSSPSPTTAVPPSIPQDLAAIV
jgi:hypothetical protein